MERERACEEGGGQGRLALSWRDVGVIVFVCAVAGAIGVPLIGHTRELSRRQACKDHLRQLGAALANYHDTHQRLPAAAVWTAEGENLPSLYESETSPRVTHRNWLLALLPHTADARDVAGLNDALPMADAENAAVRTGRVPFLVCPSDPFNRSDNLYALNLANGTTAAFARGNYAINGGSHRDQPSPGNTASPCPNGFTYEYDSATGQFRWFGTGVAGINTSFAYDDFHNGRSTTVAVDEVRAGVSPLDSRGVWALGQIGGSITWAHGVSGDAGGPNNPWKRSDDILGCGELHRALGADRLERLGMPCCHYCRWNAQATARSLHQWGVNVLMLDGSARFIGDTVDPGVWHAIHSRETRSNLLAEAFEGLIATPSESRVPEERVSDYPMPAVAGPASVTDRAEDFVNAVGSRFVRIPAGEFVMGIPDDGNDDGLPLDTPAHQVRITRPFYLGACEVTQQEFERVMGWNPSWHSATGGGADQVRDRDTSQFPVENVSWFDCARFCEELSSVPEEMNAGRRYRLPTEAEWEYACRSGKSVPYLYKQQIEPGDKSGETAGRNNRMRDRGLRTPLPVGPVRSFPPNGWGLHDMRGNVWEWCQDWFRRDYYKTSPVDDPQGPATGFIRVARGSDWRFVGEGCKIDRVSNEPFRKSPFIGFRVVCDVKQSGER
jgi:formylglycine-generating enzyme required for sulfatase activity